MQGHWGEAHVVCLGEQHVGGGVNQEEVGGDEVMQRWVGGQIIDEDQDLDVI